MRRLSTRAFLTLALALAVGLAVFASPYASGAPDGLERVAASKGFGDEARVGTVQDEAPAAGYAMPGIGDPRLAKAVAGFLGTTLVVVVAFALVPLARRRSTADAASLSA